MVERRKKENKKTTKEMTRKDRAKELVEKFAIEIGSSDFHIPEFITGVKMADGSKEYEKILDEETEALARNCASVCCDMILRTVYVNTDNYQTKYWKEIKQEIEGLE